MPGLWRLEKPHLAPWHREILTHRIKPIQQDRIGKNATDHLLLIEAVEIMGTDFYEGTADIFIIVSGDGGFIPLCTRIKQKGKKIIGIGKQKQTSPDLQKACDQFFFIEDLDKKLNKSNPAHTTPPNSPSLKGLKKLLDRAFSQLPQEDGWVNYSSLGNKLRELEPNFESKFGSQKLSTVIKKLKDHFESREQLVRKIDSDPETVRKKLMLEAYHQTCRPDGLAHRSQFVEALRKLDPEFKTRFSGKTPSKWLEAYAHIFKIQNDYIALIKQ